VDFDVTCLRHVGFRVEGIEYGPEMATNGRTCKSARSMAISSVFRPRGLFLIDTVRTRRKPREAGVEQLQVLEGFSHAHHAIDPFLPESKEAYAEITRFMAAGPAK
jgi:hypothetical protein